MKQFTAVLENDAGEEHQVEFDALDYGSATEYLNAAYPDEVILSVDEVKSSQEDAAVEYTKGKYRIYKSKK